MPDQDLDDHVRLAAFAFLELQTELHGEVVFPHEGPFKESRERRR